VGGGHTNVRVGSVQSPGSTSLLGHVMTCLEQRAPLYLSPDASGSVMFPADAADVLASVAAERLTGVVHIANAGTPSEVEFANHVLSVGGGDTSPTRPPVVNGDVGRCREPWIGTGLCCDVLAAAGITPVRPWFESLTSAFGGALISA
jgi:dTDP-4-dehydrorhamnose reductase